jgi:hypothetical protein
VYDDAAFISIVRGPAEFASPHIQHRWFVTTPCALVMDEISIFDRRFLVDDRTAKELMVAVNPSRDVSFHSSRSCFYGHVVLPLEAVIICPARESSLLQLSTRITPEKRSVVDKLIIKWGLESLLEALRFLHKHGHVQLANPLTKALHMKNGR